MSTYAETPEKTDTETKLEKAKRRIKASRDAFKEQRSRENGDLQFQVPELQWDEAAKKARSGGMVNGISTSPRPILSINKLDQPIQLVQNQARQAKLGVNIHPVSEKASKETAEILQGLYRRIERDSHADQARLWAFDRAVKAGLGAYLVTTKWDEDSDPQYMDQEITIDRLLYQSMCGWDPSAQKPDFSDGEYSWAGGYVTHEAFKRQWPKASLSQCESESELADIAGKDSDWFVGEGPDRKILVVTYWYKVHDYVEITAGEGKQKRSRKRDMVTIRCAKITATDELEDEETNGHLLPLIPVLGRELQPFSAERRWVGMIGPAKDGQRLVNFSASTFVESMASEPKNPWVGAEGQFEGHETEWEQANVRPMPFLQYKPVSLGGTQAPAPMRTQVDTSRMQLSIMGMQEGDQMIQSTTSIYDPSLGRNNPRDKSGKAILALQGQADAGTSHFLAYYADISLTYEAQVVLDLMPSIYDRPGRVTRILTGEDKDKMVMLNRPFTPNAEGFPQAVPQQMGPGGQPVPGVPEGAKLFDLRDAGGYSVSVSIGKSFQTRLQQGSEQIGEILSNAPDLLPVIGDIYFKYQDIPGADEISKRVAKWREKVMPGLGEAEDGQQPTADQLQAQLQAMQAQGQQMQQELQLAMEQIKTDQAKQQAQILQAQLAAQTTIRKTELDNAARLAVAELNAKVKGGTLAQEAQTGQVEKAEDHAFDFDQNAKDRTLDLTIHREKLAHDVGMAAAGGNTVKRTRESGQEQDQEQGQEQTSGGSEQSAPKPSDAGSK